MGPKKYGIDVDGVLADFNTAYIDLVIKLSGRNLFPLKPFDIPCWNYPEFYGYTKAEVRAAWDAINSNPYFWATLPAYEGTKQVLQLLSAIDGDEGAVYFITTRTGINPKKQTAQWLVKHGFIGWPSVIVSSKKGPVAQGIDLDVFIDDKTENCIDVTSAMGLKCNVFMLNQPWNAEFTDLRSIKRVNSVQEFMEAI